MKRIDKNSLREQFVPKYKRKEVLLKIKLEKIKTENDFDHLTCKICNNVNIIPLCKCGFFTRQCINGHNWYYCKKHRIRVNSSYDSFKPCGDHQNISDLYDKEIEERKK